MTVINIKYVNPAKDGKKFGSIAGTDGTRYMVPAGMVSAFQPNTTVDVPTKVEQWGATSVTIVAGHASAAPVNSAPPQQSYSPPPPSTAAPQAHSYASHAAGVDKDAFIFVTGLVGRAMGSGTFKSGDMSDLTHEALKAWFLLKDQLK